MEEDPGGGKRERMHKTRERRKNVSQLLSESETKRNTALCAKKFHASRRGVKLIPGFRRERGHLHRGRGVRASKRSERGWILIHKRTRLPEGKKGDVQGKRTRESSLGQLKRNGPRCREKPDIAEREPPAL